MHFIAFFLVLFAIVECRLHLKWNPNVFSVIFDMSYVDINKVHYCTHSRDLQAGTAIVGNLKVSEAAQVYIRQAAEIPGKDEECYIQLDPDKMAVTFGDDTIIDFSQVTIRNCIIVPMKIDPKRIKSRTTLGLAWRFFKNL